MSFRGPFAGPFQCRMETPHYGSPSATTKARLDELGEIAMVPWGHYAVASIPLASFNYSGCRALILQSDGSFGLSHIYGCKDNVDEYVNGMIRELPDRKLNAVIIAGYDPDDIAKACKRHKINIIGMEIGRRDERDVIVIPSSREIEVIGERSRLTMSFDNGTWNEYLF